jgi:hypothetical protein
MEFDSTYRDRNQWPLPSYFRVDISQTGTRNRFQAVDPISSAAPRLVFTGSFDNTVASPTLAVASVLTTGIGLSNNPNKFAITTAANTLIDEKDFYVGSSITLTNGATTVMRTITSYELIDGTIASALIMVATPVPDVILTAGTTGSLNNATDATSATLPVVFLPNGADINNFYSGCPCPSLTNPNIVNSNSGFPNCTDFKGGNCIITNVSLGIPYQTRTIVSYDGTTHLAELDSPAPGWLPEHTYIVRDELPCGSGVVGASTTSTVTLAAGSSTIDNFYVGNFLRIDLIPAAIVPPYDSLPAPYNEQRRIISYDGTTMVATVFPPFTVAPSAPNNTYEIECFTRDNAVPFNYTGSLVSQQQAVCYEIELVNLIVPNKMLCSGKGGRVAFYPYLYVGLDAVSSSTSGNKGLIYSNNPHSTRKMFRAVVDDTPTPLISPFVKIDGDGMVQTVKFKPNDSFIFSVCHSDGTFFQTEDVETFGPTFPNPLTQISALFQIRRVAS